MKLRSLTSKSTKTSTAPQPRAARRKSGGTTLREVAKMAGVSVITASRALNTPDKVSPDALKRIRAAVTHTGYVPNLLAGGLASNRSRLVAAVVPAIAGSVFMETIQALTDELASAGFQLMLGQSGYRDSREDALLDAIIGRRPDGIVLTGVMRSPEGRRRLLASGIPVVETWDLTPTPIDMLVGFSHEKVGAEVAAYLYRKGYRRCAIVTADDHRAGLRRKGFEARWRAQTSAGAKTGKDHAIPVWTVPAPSTLAGGRAALTGLLAQHPRLDVIWCSSDVLAHGVITEAHARGLQVPNGLAVHGFGDLAFAAHTHPALTTVRIDGTAIGREAARCLIERNKGERLGPNVRDIGFSIVERASA
jgi:LacI family transcriptional regulator, gluconate utilization system Gnt-I transcriptional repressor